jgi:hypothetical protein
MATCCRYIQIDKHLHNRATQWIIFGGFKFGWLLPFEEAMNKEKVVYDNIEVGGSGK